jgi:hypothetical protein
MFGKTFQARATIAIRRIRVAFTAATFVLACTTVHGQQTAPANSIQGLELPVVMKQNVASGKTPVGTKVSARLTVATLVKGTVIPVDAVLSGEVTESVAKSGNDPARLAIRMDSAQWKTGSLPLNVYLSAWYYPVSAPTPSDLSAQPGDASHSSANWGGGPYGNQNSHQSPPLPGTGNDADSGNRLPSQQSGISQHRLLMKDVDAVRNSQDGAVALTSTHANIKLDKSTTYVLAASDPAPSGSK